MLKYRLQFTKPKRIMKINVVRIMSGCKCNHIQAYDVGFCLYKYKQSIMALQNIICSVIYDALLCIIQSFPSYTCPAFHNNLPFKS